MTLVLTAALRMEAAQAKAELAATRQGVQGLTAATVEQTTKSRAAAGAADAETAAKRRNAQASREMATANRQAAGATGNLVAQFNDIGMMIAAGQNPLQLAIQQGTQITQVIGGQGAAGAVGLLGRAFAQAFSPMNLLFIAGLAGGTAMIQWLTSAGDSAVTLEQRIEAVNDAVERWRDESGRSFDDLRERFGTITPEIVAMQREMTQLRIAEIMQEADAAARQLADTIGTGMFSSVGGDLRRLFLESGIVLGTSQMQEFRAALEAVGNASGIGEQLAAVEALRTQFDQITGGIENMSSGQREFYSTLLQTESALRAAAVATGEIDTKTQDAAVAATELVSRAQAVVSAIASADGSRLVAAFQSAFPVASQLLGMAQGIIATINQAGAFQSAETAGLAAQYAQYGAGRVAGERLAKESGPLFGNRRVIPLPTGAAGSGGGAAAARDEASALQELIASLEAEIEALRVQDPLQQEMLKHREALAGATEAERQKVEELIATREREALLMEGAKARAAFFEDIGTQALDALIMKGESFNDVLQNIIRSLIQAVAQAAIFGSGPFGSLFGGKSILSGLFGGGGGGGLAGLFGSGKAEGGMIYGPGTGTSDSILTPTSNGEFVVNAQATARNRQLLEVINAGGQVRGFATGGYVGSDTRRLAARGDSNLPASIYIDLRGSNGDQAIEERVRKGAAEVVQLYDREGLAVSIQRVSSDPKRRG